MTYAEYLEKNNVSFTDVMNLFNESKYSSFDVFLKSEYKEHKFKINDLVVLQLNEYTKNNGWTNNVVFKIIGINESNNCYEVKFLTPTNRYDINYTRIITISFIDSNCVLY